MSSESSQSEVESKRVTVDNVVTALTNLRSANGVSIRRLKQHIGSSMPARLSDTDLDRQVRQAVNRGIRQGLIMKRARGDAGDADWMTTRMHKPSAQRCVLCKRRAYVEDGGKAEGEKEPKTKSSENEAKEDESKDDEGGKE